MDTGNILMTITHKEIRVQRPKINLQMPNPMRSINTTQYPQLFTRCRQLLKRHPHTGHADHRIEYSDPDFPAGCFYLLYLGFESRHKPLIFDGIGVGDFNRRCRCGFGDV